MDESLLNGEPLFDEDRDRLENPLRPKFLMDFQGQDDIKETLNIF